MLKLNHFIAYSCCYNYMHVPVIVIQVFICKTVNNDFFLSTTPIVSVQIMSANQQYTYLVCTFVGLCLFLVFFTYFSYCFSYFIFYFLFNLQCCDFMMFWILLQHLILYRQCYYVCVHVWAHAHLLNSNTSTCFHCKVVGNM